MKKRDFNPSRRRLLRDAAIAGVGGVMMPFTTLANTEPAKDGWMTAENKKPGTAEWQLKYTGFDDPVTMASYPYVRGLRSTAIEGFVSKTSVLPGESIDFKISTSPVGTYRIDIYRMGYYGGLGGRFMTTLGTFKGSAQPMPMMTTERLRECNWETATTYMIPQDWPPGVYLGKLSREEPFGRQSYVIFVVKHHRRSDLLYQVSDLTWQAYNKWPSRDSLYDDGTPNLWYLGSNVRVSFNRPYAKHGILFDAPLSAGSGEFLLWEHPMVYWLEQQGYDVNYCSNLDLHSDPKILSLTKVFLSVAHDEYWSRKMYDEVTKARDNGLSLAFFCGNSVYGEVMMHDSELDGRPARSFSRIKPFEDCKELMGMSSYGVGYGDWTIKKSDHWIFKGTGLKNGDSIPSIIGWEYHGPPYPDIPGLEVVAESPLQMKNVHAAVVYPCPKGNWVFNAGTIWWPEGLSQPPGHIPAGNNSGLGRTMGVNPHVQKITTNVLNRMIKDSPIRI